MRSTITSVWSLMRNSKHWDSGKEKARTLIPVGAPSRSLSIRPTPKLQHRLAPSVVRRFQSTQLLAHSVCACRSWMSRSSAHEKSRV